MNQRYEPPAITAELGRQTPESAAERNRFARGRDARLIEEIDGVAVAELARRFGTPLFVFSEAGLREKARAMRHAFARRYDRFSFAWSYKTNYLNAVCEVFHSEGWIADVASELEYAKARALGQPPGNIVFNGPSKSRASLVRALSEGALVQIDNWDELALVEEIVASLPGPIDVGIRVCLDAGVRPAWTKFGFMLATGEAARAAARIIAHPKLRLHTLHTHIGTYILEAKAYGTATKLLIALLDAIENEHGHRVACLNLGGGFASNSLLHTMAGPAEREVPRIDAYAEAITAELARLPKGRRPLLRLEAGRHLVDEAGYLLTSVVAVKGMRPSFAAAPDLTGLAQKQQVLLGTDARVGYVIDAGINLLYTAAWFRIDAIPARDAGARHVPSRLYGPLCMAIDVVREEVDLPPLETGDLLTLHPVGAYNSNQAMQFIDPRPAMVMIGRNGAVGLMRRRETVEDFNGPEQSLVEIARER